MTDSAAPATTWKFDAAHSSVAFSVRHMMFTTVRGRFGDVDGTIVTNGELPRNASVSVGIKAASIDTGLEARDAHLRALDFLDTDAFPLITFVGTKILGGSEVFELTGDLTIRGITRQIVLDVRHDGSGKDPWGGERMGFTASGTLDRRGFGLRWNETLESGGVLVGNEIRISIDAQLVRVG